MATVGNTVEKIRGSYIEDNTITSNHLDSSVSTRINNLIEQYINDNEIGGSGDSVVDPVIWKYMCNPINLYEICINIDGDTNYSYDFPNDFKNLDKLIFNNDIPTPLFYKLTTSLNEFGEYIPFKCYYHEGNITDSVNGANGAYDETVIKYEVEVFPEDYFTYSNPEGHCYFMINKYGISYMDGESWGD